MLLLSTFDVVYCSQMKSFVTFKPITQTKGLTVEHLGSIWVEYDALPGKGHRAGLSAVTLYGTVYAFGGQERSVSDRFQLDLK